MKQQIYKDNVIAYYVKCPESQCSEDYTVRVLEHNDGDTKSHLVNHAIEKCHKYPKIEDFNIIDKSFRNNTFKRKVAESLLIKDVRTTLSTREICGIKAILLI